MDKFGIFNIISTLSNVLMNNNGKKETPPEEKELSAIKNAGKNTGSSTPLQSSMLNTMKSHDEFVKRVTSSNKNSRGK